MFLYRITNRYWSSFHKFTQLLAKIQSTSLTNTKKSILTEYLNVQKDDHTNIMEIFNFVEGNTKINLAEKTLYKFFGKESGISEKMKSLDILDAIVQNLKPYLKKNGNNPTLQTAQIVNSLKQLGSISGKNSQAARIQIVFNIISKCSTEQELKFYLRILVKNLRIGMKKNSLENSLNQLDYGYLQEQTKYFNPMLARPLRDQAELKDFCTKKNEILVDIKFDGQRTMIYYTKDFGVQLISRRKKTQNQIYPILVDKLEKQFKNYSDIESIVIDGQLVCVSEKDESPLPFQSLIARRGKQTIQEMGSYGGKQLIYCFDVLEYNGVNLIEKDILTRRGHLQFLKKQSGAQQILKPVENVILEYPSEYERLKELFNQAISKKYEGLILKGLTDPYNLLGSRRFWGKMKKGLNLDEQSKKMVIELDLVVMGADYGNGKRSQYFSSYLLGLKHQDKIYPLSKVGTGFTDQNLRQFTQLLSNNKSAIRSSQYQIPKSLNMDVWFQPNIIFQVICQQFTRSPLYSFSYKQGYGGISMRFPVFQRIRPDKSLNQCTKGQQIAQFINDI